jgi:hypothetical protein
MLLYLHIDIIPFGFCRIIPIAAVLIWAFLQISKKKSPKKEVAKDYRSLTAMIQKSLLHFW